VQEVKRKIQIVRIFQILLYLSQKNRIKNYSKIFKNYSKIISLSMNCLLVISIKKMIF